MRALRRQQRARQREVQARRQQEINALHQQEMEDQQEEEEDALLAEQEENRARLNAALSSAGRSGSMAGRNRGGNSVRSGQQFIARC